MGGKGSGTWPRRGAKGLVDRALALDAPHWRRAGVIAPNTQRAGVVAWYAGDACIARLRYATACSETAGTAVLAYRRASQQVVVKVALGTVRSNLGIGYIWMFTCPTCQRRAKRLYVTAAGVTCRRCAGLAYRSQREWHIPARLARRLAQRLGEPETAICEAVRALDRRTIRLLHVML